VAAGFWKAKTFNSAGKGGSAGGRRKCAVDGEVFQNGEKTKALVTKDRLRDSPGNKGKGFGLLKVREWETYSKVFGGTYLKGSRKTGSEVAYCRQAQLRQSVKSNHSTIGARK